MNLNPATSKNISQLAQAAVAAQSAADDAQEAAEATAAAATSGATAAIPSTIRNISVTANAQSLNVTDVSTAYCTPDANRTGLILAYGLDGQRLMIVNASSSYSMTFAAVGTSLVSTGAACVIAPLTAKEFTWNAVTVSNNYWYEVK